MVYRQGDIILRRVNSLPLKSLLAGNELEMKGETGQSHRLEAKVFTAPEVKSLPQVYIEVDQFPKPMVHPQHPDLVVAPGIYKVDRIRSYVSSQKIPRYVVD